MKKILWVALVIVVLLIIGIWYDTAKPVKAPVSDTMATTDLGTYAYECDEHVAFTMTPASDMGSIAIAPTSASSTYPPATTLYKEPVSSGVRYVGSGIVFSGRGETVTLAEGDSAITCSPVPSQDMAPFNFGD
ncbi:MAG TPA: hypothetical protein VHD38_00540 [Candidatus Paceibacterota bacterium]|nr:hypothetical protein [Candidatus Paceibacterota bacterium]